MTYKSQFQTDVISESWLKFWMADTINQANWHLLGLISQVHLSFAWLEVDFLTSCRVTKPFILKTSQNDLLKAFSYEHKLPQISVLSNGWNCIIIKMNLQHATPKPHFLPFIQVFALKLSEQVSLKMFMHGKFKL